MVLIEVVWTCLLLFTPWLPFPVNYSVVSAKKLDDFGGRVRQDRKEGDGTYERDYVR